MTAEYAALEARVSELEHQVRHTLPAKIDAVSYGVSLVHADTQAIRADLDELRAGQARQDAQLEQLNDRLANQDARLSHQGQRLDRMNQRFDRTDQRLDDMNQRFDRTDQRLDQHGDLLRQILRRLPAPPA